MLLEEISHDEDLDAGGEWHEAPLADLWDLKSASGRGWMWHAFIPALMGILESSTIPGATTGDGGQ